MKLYNAITILSILEKRFFEILPIRTIIVICLIAILFQLNAINFCVSGIEARSRGSNHADMGKEAINMYEEGSYREVVAFEVMHKRVSVSKLRDPLRIFEQWTYVHLMEAEIRGYPFPEIRQIKVSSIKNEERYVSESIAKEMG